MAEYREKGDNDEFLRQLRQNYSDDESSWKPIRDDARIDMRIVGGNGWDKAEEAIRASLKRLALNFDEVSQYTNQLINDIHQNKRAIKVTPNGNGAQDKEAELRANRIRQIEYRSNAQQVHTITFKNTVERSYGWARLNTRWLNEDKKEQELFFEAVPNPDMVTPGPHIMPDGSDIKRLWFKEWWTHEEFRAKLPNFPEARIKDFSSSEWGDVAPDWIESKRILICEYWVKKLDGSVCMYLTNGIDVLKKSEWAGKDIPFVSCYGPVIFVTDGGKTERRIHSYHRLARDPIQSYNFTLTAIAEMISQIPKFPYMVRENSLSDVQLQELQRSVSEPVAVIQVRSTLPEQTGPPGFVPEMPVRNPYDPSALAGLMAVAEAFRRSIQAAMGQSPLPTQAQRRNEKSGVALKQIEDSGQRGSYHFIASYEGYLVRLGKLTNDMLGPIHDTARDMTVRKPDDTTQVVRINDPQWQNPDTNESEHLQFSDGDFDVTISTGPQNDSEREAQSDFADLLLQSPEIAQIIGPQNMAKVLAKVIKLKNVGPLGDAIADIIDPPQQDGQVDPQQQAKQMAQAQQAVELLTKQVEGLTHTIQTDAVKMQGQIRLQEMKDATSIRVAEINAAVKGYLTELQHAADHEQQALGHSVDMHEGEQDRQHEAALAQMQHEQGMEAGEAAGAQQSQLSSQDHQESLEQGAAGHEQQLEQGAQAAALAPKPEEGE